MIQHRQHARHGQIDKAGLRIRLCTEGNGRARKYFGVGGELGMGFHANDDFPGHVYLSASGYAKAAGVRRCQSVTC